MACKGGLVALIVRRAGGQAGTDALEGAGVGRIGEHTHLKSVARRTGLQGEGQEEVGEVVLEGRQGHDGGVVTVAVDGQGLGAGVDVRAAVGNIGIVVAVAVEHSVAWSIEGGAGGIALEAFGPRQVAVGNGDAEGAERDSDRHVGGAVVAHGDDRHCVVGAGRQISEAVGAAGEAYAVDKGVAGVELDLVVGIVVVVGHRDVGAGGADVAHDDSAGTAAAGSLEHREVVETHIAGAATVEAIGYSSFGAGGENRLVVTPHVLFAAVGGIHGVDSHKAAGERVGHVAYHHVERAVVEVGPIGEHQVLEVLGEGGQHHVCGIAVAGIDADGLVAVALMVPSRLYKAVVAVVLVDIPAGDVDDAAGRACTALAGVALEVVAPWQGGDGVALGAEARADRRGARTVVADSHNADAVACRGGEVGEGVGGVVELNAVVVDIEHVVACVVGVNDADGSAVGADVAHGHSRRTNAGGSHMHVDVVDMPVPVVA